jgi:hypothetical protein
MKKEDTPDKFEEFLKKTLDHYEENPPESQWSAIQTRIPTGSHQPQTGLFGGKRPWQLIAACLLFLTALVGQRYYYTQSPKAASQTIILAQEQALLQLQKEVELLKLQVESQRAATAQIQEVTNAFSQETTGTQGNSSAQRQIESFLGTRNTGNLNTESAQIGGRATDPSRDTTHTDIGIEPIQSVSNQEAVPSQTAGIGKNNQAKSYLAVLPTESISRMLSYPTYTSSRFVFAPTMARAAKQSDLSLIAYSQIHSTKQTIDNKPDDRGRPDDFAKQDYARYGTEWQAGILAQRQLSQKWAARFGLGYAQHTATGQHEIMLKPKRPIGPGVPPGIDSLTFLYTIQTGGGIADIELRAIDNNHTPHNDDFDVQLTTTEQLKSIVLPFGLEYTALRLGRWSSSLQGTVLLSLPVSKRISIDDLVLTGSAPLQLEPRDRQRADMRRGNDASLNASGQFGLALAYQVNRKVAVSLSPQVSYKLNKTLENGWANHRMSTIGVQLGLRYDL